jgi:CDP-diacylglycerol--glycerol-3-phosphate 3-phosphatidyltransferase
VIQHLPNVITASRGLCGPVVAWLVWELGANHVAFWVFLLAISTDMLDGYVARRLNATSELALLLDPLSDKLLTDFTWTALAAVGYAPVWLAATVVTRDVFVAAVWWWSSRRGHRWLPRPSGQIGVSFEAIALSVLLFHGPFLDVHWPTVGTVLGTIGLALSVLQLLEYAWGRSSP